MKPRKSTQQNECVNVWAGIIGNTLVGPKILPDRLTSANYLQFLIDLAPELMDEVPLAVRNRLIYQQDGAPAYWGQIVRLWLNENYTGRWIGRGGPIPWPPRSPDLTPLDFYLWGFMKEHVYAAELQTRDQLLQRIEEAADKVRENMQQFNMNDAVKNRLQMCLTKNGNHFENLL